jgi:hypothetical protein
MALLELSFLTLSLLNMSADCEDSSMSTSNYADDIEGRSNLLKQAAWHDTTTTVLAQELRVYDNRIKWWS